MEPLELRDDTDAPGDNVPSPEPSPGSGDTSNPSQATRLVQIVEGIGVLLFHDDRGDGWAQFTVKDHREHWPCRSKGFKRWLARLFWMYEGKAPNSDAINAAVNVLEARARFDGSEHALHNRVAVVDNAIWYDLADPEWRAVRITADGWQIEANPPILFRRFSHQRAQVVPRAGGDLRKLLEFLNIRDPRHQLLLLVYVVICMVPEIPHPIPVLHGPQGAAKTSLFRMLRRIVDPSLTETLTAPGNITEIVQQLSHHWIAYYDNLTTLPGWLSDVLCRAVTGEGFSKRELYTDDDDVIYHFRRCCGLNGINVAAAKPDLLDRALLFGLDQIPKNKRRAEKAIWRSFEQIRPDLLGATFDALSGAMRILPTVELGELDRMADFMLWGCAVSEALGYSREEFLDAVDRNFHTRNEEIITSDPVATATVAFMNNRAEWQGSASTLLGELEQVATDLKLDRRSNRWPKGPNTLSRRLNEVASNLAAIGIAVTQNRTRRERSIGLRREPGPPGRRTEAGDERDEGDGTDQVPSRVSSPEKGRESWPRDDGDEGDGISPSLKGAVEPGPETTPALKSAESIVTTVTTVTTGQFPGLFGDDTGDDTSDNDDPELSREEAADGSDAASRVCACCSGTVFWQSAQGATLCQRCGTPFRPDTISRR